MPPSFPPLFLLKSCLKSHCLLIFLAFINGASNFNTPSESGSLATPRKNPDSFPGHGNGIPRTFKYGLSDDKDRGLSSYRAGVEVFVGDAPDLPSAPDCADPDRLCSDLSAHCLLCDIGSSVSPDCIYGEMTNYTCQIKDRSVVCQGPRKFHKEAPCRFCYQTSLSEHRCIASTVNCHVAGMPYHHRVTTNCSVNGDVVCLGQRTFYKTDLCNYSTGYRWSTAMLLSVTVGGFGGDRFYLGQWREGTGKLFSFGGLGVWTIVDIILIAVGYVRPEDGSLYIDL